LPGTPFGDDVVSAFEKIHRLLPHEVLLHFGDLDETLLVKGVGRPNLPGREKETGILNWAVAETRALVVFQGNDLRVAWLKIMHLEQEEVLLLLTNPACPPMRLPRQAVAGAWTVIAHLRRNNARQ